MEIVSISLGKFIDQFRKIKIHNKKKTALKLVLFEKNIKFVDYERMNKKQKAIYF